MGQATTKTGKLTSQIHISIDGTEIQKPIIQKLAEVTVEQSSHLPCAFMIRLHDKGLELLDQGIFDPTHQVEISAETTEGKRVLLVKGDITALEPEFGEGMIAQLVVRGYDPSHRLFRQTKTRAFLNVKDSDLAEQFAKEAGLEKKVDATSTVYEHLFQANQSDLAFLMERAWRIGYECFVSNRTLYFRKPLSGGEAVKLTWGDDLLSFKPRLNLAEQVNQVFVKGWDVEKQAPLVGRAEKGSLAPKIGEKKDGVSWAKPFGQGELTIVDQPVINQEEANILAKARMDEISGAFLEADGIAFRRPDVCAGQVVKIENLGKRFSGCYLVTGATHQYTSSGLHTYFSVRGVRTGLLLDEIYHSTLSDRWPALVVGVVSKAGDQKHPNRVCIKFPWIADEADSGWARVLGCGAGDRSGFFAMPEKGDEVLVAFLHGDINQPVVLGGLWNGKSSIPPEGGSVGEGEKPKVRVWRSRHGHSITLYDNAPNKIEILTAGKDRSICLDDSKNEIIFKNQKVTVTVKSDSILIDGGDEVEIRSNGSLNLEANRDINIKANGQVNVKGQQIRLN